MEEKTVREVAESVGVSMSLVYQWCNERRLPHLRLGKNGKRGKILINQSDLTDFLKSLRVEPEQRGQTDGLRHIIQS